MRKFLKNNILEIFKTMYEAHDNIKKLIGKKDFENVRVLLGDCQNTAVQIGTIIENSEGEGFVTVGLLEEYCEAVYEVSISISEEVNGNKAQKKLDKILIKAENSVKNDINVKLEIVFLPYKSSMWDSLESVWKAANEDPGCNAHVIPIPYYDRKPDGSFGEMHYEGAEYPDYVPIMHYEAYDLEKMRPDVIYIHNPYDECNYVTSVSEQFYSSNLKKNTDKLVYIPYFVLGEPDPDNEQTLENISHFVLTPGVINADEVIVQSEAMKQAYIKILLKQYGDTAENRKMFDKKILGIGSPKLDKIANMRIENIEIPAEWQRIIQKPDGSRKKIVFYNTGISALLSGGEAWIRKFNASISAFKNISEDVALLWRPHPLIEATMKSMRTDILNKYLNIKNTYIKEKWGIVDKSADLSRAVTLSDAFWGDESSVVELFKKLKKPTAIMQFNYPGDENAYPALGCIISVNDYLYASCKFNNALLKICKHDGKSEVMAYFEGDSGDLYLSAVKYKEKIFWIPMNAKKIAVFDIISNSITYIDLPSIINAEAFQKFRSALIYDNKILMFGYTIPYICTIDCTSYSVDAISFVGVLAKANVYFAASSCIRNNFAYVPMYGFNKVMKINLSDISYQLFDITVQTEDVGFSYMIADGNNFRLFNAQDEEIIWNEEDGVISRKLHELNPCKIKTYKIIISNEQSTIRFPYFWPCIFIENNDGTRSDINFSNNVKNIIDKCEYAFLCVLEDENDIFFQTNCDLKLYRMNKTDLALSIMYSCEENCEVDYLLNSLLRKITK